MGVYDFLCYKSSFPQCRIQKLMNLDRYCGLTAHVLVEGAFIELTSDGLPEQQLFLGLTANELIFVKQAISPKADVKNTNDLELEGLFIDAILPLSNIIISLSDKTPMTFSVITQANKILWFEMCKLDAGFRTLWNVWDKLLNEAIEKQNQNNSRNLVSEIPLDSNHKLVRSASLSSSYDSSSSESSISTSSADSDQVKSVSHQLGVAPCRRLRFLYGGHPTVYSATCSNQEKQTALVKSSSWSDVTSCCKESTRTVDMDSFRKILKRRDKLNKHTTERTQEFNHGDTSSDEEEIDDLVLEITHSQERKDNARTGTQLWKRARELVFGKSNAMMQLIAFQEVSARRKPVARCIQDCNPLDVALELNAMSRRLMMTIRPSDLESYRATITQSLPTSIQRISHYGDTLRKCVMAEIIANSVLTDRVSAIVFFIRVSHHLLFSQRDFQSLICVLQGMTSLPIYRLQDTWATLFVQNPLQFSEFQAMASMLSPVGHYKSYRSRVDLCKLRKASFVPWFDHYFLHCKGRKFSYQNVDISVVMPLTTHIRLNSAMSIKVLQNNTISTYMKSKANVQPYVQPNDKINTEPLRSILKKRKIKRKKSNGVKKLFKTKKQKTVKFLLSEKEIERSLEHGTKTVNMKHLAKTRLKHSIHNEYRNRETMPIERYAEETSKAILDEGFKSMFQFNSIGSDVKQSTNKETRRLNTVHTDVKPPSNREVRRLNTANTDVKPSSKKEVRRLNTMNTDVKPSSKKEVRRLNDANTDVKPSSKKEVRRLNTANTDVKPSSKKAIEGKSQHGGKGQKKPGDGDFGGVVEIKKKPSKTSMMMSWMKEKMTRRKASKKVKEDIKHVNLVQTEIDTTNNLLRGLEQFNDDTMDINNENTLDVRNVTKNDKMEDNNIEMSVTVSDNRTKKDGTSRRKSYVPASIAQNRRKSLFEQAYDGRKDHDAEDDFTHSLDAKLQGLKDKRKSVVLELLDNDDMLDVRHQNVSSNAGNEMVRLGSPNSLGKSDNTKSNLFRNASAENLGIDHELCDNCIVCGREPCIYPECVYHQLILFQTCTPQNLGHSRRRVRECLSHLMNSVKYLRHFDLLSLSLIKE